MSFQTWRLLCFRARKFPLVIIAVRVFIWQTIKIKARMQPSSSGRRAQHARRVCWQIRQMWLALFQADHAECTCMRCVSNNGTTQISQRRDAFWSSLVFLCAAANTSRLALRKTERQGTKELWMLLPANFDWHFCWLPGEERKKSAAPPLQVQFLSLPALALVFKFNTPWQNKAFSSKHTLFLSCVVWRAQKCSCRLLNPPAPIRFLKIYTSKTLLVGNLSTRIFIKNRLFEKHKVAAHQVFNPCDSRSCRAKQTKRCHRES